MIQLIKLTYNDDKDGSKRIEVMMCSAIGVAKEIILTEINNVFDGVWDSLQEASKELSEELVCCVWDEDCKTFHWYDNGKGETYIIGRINERQVNAKWQVIGEVS